MAKDNYYEILKLKEDCSHKDIKDAFVTLSKMYHPDKTKNKVDNALFLKVNEAYSVLNKPASRRMYDDGLLNNDGETLKQYQNPNVYGTNPFVYKNYNGGSGTEEPYYSIKGVKRVSNKTIASICFAIAVIGITLEGFALRKSIDFDREQLKQDSARNHIIWEQAKQQAAEKGNEGQIAAFKKNILISGSMKIANNEYKRRLLEDQLKGAPAATEK